MRYRDVSITTACSVVGYEGVRYPPFVPSRVARAIWGVLWFRMNFRISSKKNTVAILVGFALHLYVALGSVDILILLILPTRGQGYSLPFICIFFSLFHVFCFRGTIPLFHIFGSVHS